MRTFHFAFPLPILAMLLQMSVGQCGAATPPSLSVVKLAFPNVTFGRSAMVTDPQGNVYLGGTTGDSIGQPNYGPVTSGAAQTQPGGICIYVVFGEPGGVEQPLYCADGYIAKMKPDGTLVYATYLGGGTGNDTLTAITVDASGNVYVAGTTSGGLPTTPNAVASAPTNAFAAKLNPAGSQYLYITYLPGGGTPAAIAVDAAGNAYITGQTSSNQAFVEKLNAAGSALLYDTVLPGGPASGLAITADAHGDAYVAGQTLSSNFPVSQGAFQTKLTGCPAAPSNGCAGNAFVAELGPLGNHLLGTYLGGSGTENPLAIQIDSEGYVYVAGGTTSVDFPTTSKSNEPVALVPLWSSPTGNPDANPGGFATKLLPGLNGLAYSTFVFSAPSNMAVDNAGGVYVAGLTGAGVPVTPSAPQPCMLGAMDAFVTHLDQNAALLDRSYMNASGFYGNDQPVGLALTGVRSVRLATFNAAGVGAAMAELQFGDPGTGAAACLSPVVLNAASFFDASANSVTFLPDGQLTSIGPGVSPGELISLTGFGIGPAQGESYRPNPGGSVPAQLAGVQVFFGDQAAPLLYVGAQQINLIAPFELANETSANLRLAYNGMTLNIPNVSVQAADPALFRLHGGYSDQAAAINQDGTVNGPSNPAPTGSIVSVFGTGFGLSGTAGVTGAVTPLAASRYLATVSIGDVPVQYAGVAPGQLQGIGQINFLVPDVSAGALSLSLTMGFANGSIQYSDVESTIYVK